MDNLHDAYLIGPNVKILNTLIEKELNNAIGKILPGLTSSQFAILMNLHYSSEPYLIQKDLEKKLHLSHPTIRGIIKRLSLMKLITTSTLTTDRRQIILKLTETGKVFIAEHGYQIEKMVKDLENRLLKSLTKEEKEKFLETIKLIIRNF